MIARGPRPRSGITLTEILIAILIMGVGLISLATLFPLGLLRLREATRNSRAGLAFETAADDMDARSLFLKSSFTQTWYWTIVNGNRVPRDPFVQDTDSGGGIAGIIASDPTSVNGQYASTPPNAVPPNGPPLLNAGLPVCYDPLWRSITGVYPNVGLADPTLVYQASFGNTPNEARFGAGVFNGTAPYLRADPAGGNPSAYGLQRLTNFIPWAPSSVQTASNNPSLNFLYPLTCLNLNPIYSPSLSPPGQPPDVSGNVFTSIDDLVFNPTPGTPNAPSSVLPDMSLGAPQADYRFTWFFTGRQTDAGGNGAQFTGEIVVCDGRPFGFDALPGQTVLAPAGETVVEAIFGYGSNVVNPGNTPAGTGFATGADRSVLLRWPTSMPDPQVKVGGWICDVTYERNVATFRLRSINSITSFARSYWYQIGKRTDPQTDPVLGNGYRSMVVTLTSPVRAKTLLNVPAAGSNQINPVHLNVALVMPSVINVFTRSFEVH